MASRKTIQVLEVQVDRPIPTYRKRIIERWGVSGGDVREYHIGITGDRGFIRHGRTDISCDRDVLIEIARAIFAVAAQSEEAV